MILLLLSNLWALIVAGLLTRAVTQYRHYEVIRPSQRPLGQAPSVTVIVPARNEAINIGRCLDGLLTQDYPAAQLNVIVVDDNSEDETAAIVRRYTGSHQVRLLDGKPLPEGWFGKPHACWQAAAAAEGQWLCFMDADTTAEAPLIRSAVDAAESRGLDMLSLQPFQKLLTPWERLILPTGFFLLAFTQDLRRTNDPQSPAAAVNGQFLLIRRTAYDAVGGHATVHDQAAEDSALAAAVKAAGYRLAVLGTEGLLSTRMYTELKSLWTGTARQASTLLHGAIALLLVAAAAIIVAWAPLTLLTWAVGSIHHRPSAAAALVIAGVGSAALLTSHIGAARYFRIPWVYGLLFPFGYTLGAGVLVYAAIQRRRGRLPWKGRVYER